MALESFSNPACAKMLNESFVPVIVDREERPDIDTIYMNYVQAVSNSGGWPLNLFLTPELEPVFGGTYWPGPGTARHVSGDNGENGDETLDFLTIVRKVQNIWKDQETRCRKEATEVVSQLREFAAEGTLGTRGITTPSMANSFWGKSTASDIASTKQRDDAASSELDLDQLEEAYTHIAGTFDPVYGGFGLAPKFPTPAKLDFLLRLSKFPSAVQDVVGEAECKYATEIAMDTLRKIRDGALRDHVGGTGFARCSLTPDWSIPNFEKLVVDNALLLSLYLKAWSISSGREDADFYPIVIELAEYLSSSPIALPEGGFVSSEAAGSYYRRGHRDMREGAYYTWTRREFDAVLEKADKPISPVVATYWDVHEDGNVDEDHDPNDDFINQNILRVVRTREELSKLFSISVLKVDQYIQTARRLLKERRDKERVRPELDDKLVAGWNGLVISALSQTAAALKDLDQGRSGKYLTAAKKAAVFIQDKLWDESAQVLYRIWKDGRDIKGFADDYAYLTHGLLDLFDATGDESFLHFADKLQREFSNPQDLTLSSLTRILETQISLFYDPAGAFFSTTASSPHAILRLKDGMDTSLPSTNAISASNLFRLGSMLDDDDLTRRARATVNAFEVELLQHPWLFPGLLAGVVAARLGVEKSPREVTTRRA